MIQDWQKKYESASGSGCEFFEDSYLTGGYDIDIKNIKASFDNSIVRVTFDGYAQGVRETRHLVEFKMKGNQIDEVKSGHSDNPKSPPTKTDSSLRTDAQTMVNTGGCV